jgi:hypothetical protein
MSIKIVSGIFVILAIAPIAMPRGGNKATTGVQLIVVCNSSSSPLNSNGDDVCTVQATGLVPGKAYQLEASSNCADTGYYSYTADANGAINDLIGFTPPESDTPGGCQTNFWSFYLFTTSKNGSQLQLIAQTTAPDPA